VARRETMLTDRIATRAAAYGVEGQTVDGNDVEAVFEAARVAVDKVRRTRKPFLLETYTYRQWGHYEPDDQSYVDPNELAKWKARDPIDTLKKKLLDRKVLTPSQYSELESRVKATIDKAAAFTDESPFPSPEELTTDVYA